METNGIYLAADECTPENVPARFAEISDTTGAVEYEQGGQQVTKFISKAAAALSVKLT